MNLEEIRGAVRGRWLARPAGGASPDRVVVRGVSTDTRTARAGELFVAIRGKNVDAHAFLPQAASAGCAAAVVCLDGKVDQSALRALPGGAIGVADTTAALGDLASHHRALLGTAVIAVTGSNGKTTVKRMIHHILSRRFKGTCSPKSFNNEIGVPLTLLGAGPGDDYVVCEVGTSAPGEVAALAAIARPNVAVITSVTRTHLEKLGSLDGVAREKASLLGSLAENGLAVVWGDGDVLDEPLRAYKCKMVRFGVSDSCDIRLTGYELTWPSGSSGPPGQRFQVNGRLWGEMPLPGRHNAVNALAAIAAAQRLGFTQEQGAEALADFAGAEMRMEWIPAGGVTVINDAYNANPSSVAAAAEVLADCPAKRRVAVLGDMLELGDGSPELHRRTGGELASRRIGLVITVGPLARHIAEGASAAGVAAESFSSSSAAAKALPGLLRRGDAVLVKGSRGTAMERLIPAIQSAFPSGPRSGAASKPARTRRAVPKTRRTKGSGR